MRSAILALCVDWIRFVFMKRRRCFLNLWKFHFFLSRENVIRAPCSNNSNTITIGNFPSGLILSRYLIDTHDFHREYTTREMCECLSLYSVEFHYFFVRIGFRCTIRTLREAWKCRMHSITSFIEQKIENETGGIKKKDFCKKTGNIVCESSFRARSSKFCPLFTCTRCTQYVCPRAKQWCE